MSAAGRAIGAVGLILALAPPLSPAIPIPPSASPVLVPPPLAPPGPTGTALLRHDLRPGDHLVYRQTLVEETELGIPYGLPGGNAVPFERSRRTRVSAAWTSHVLVVDTAPGGFAVGFQRNREGVTVDRWEVGGVERGAEGAAGWLAYAAPEAHARFADAIRLAADGAPLDPPAAAREWASKALWAVSEVPVLPAGPVEPGDAWRRSGGLAFAWRAVEWVEEAGERCLDVEGTLRDSRILVRSSLPDTVRTTYRFCPESGLVRRVTFEGTWPGPVYQKIRETVTIELVGRSRGEEPAAWVSDPDTRRAALEALALAPAAPDPALLAPAWGDDEPGTLERALALALRFGLPVPRLEALAGHADPRVRALAARIAARRGEAAIVERARSDADGFVRRAAETPAGPREPVACEAVPGAWLRLAAEERAFPWRPPWSRLRRLEAPGLEGTPYAVHVPLGYTGEEPVPLLVYLSGNGGPVMEGVLLARAAAEKAGYLVVYPDAAGFWWSHRAARIVDAVLEEVLRDYHVDADRVYLSGLSNGGAGAYYLGVLWPHRWTAVVSAMGGGHFVPFPSRDETPIPSNAAHVPFLFLHGGRDGTISPEASRRTAALMRPHRATLETHLFPERGHGITIGRGDDDRTVEFFERHERRPVPGSLSFALTTLAWPRHYWLEVLEKDPGIARVQATVQPDGSIRLVSENVRRLRLLIHPDLLADPGSLRVVANGEEVFSGGVGIDCGTLERTWTEIGDPRLAWGAAVEIEVPAGE